jgi:transcriptional regulator with XRE-family HTH domain
MKGASRERKAKRLVVLYEGRRPSSTWVGRCTKALGAECVAIKADSVKSFSSLPERKPAAVIFFGQAAADRFLAELPMPEAGSKGPKLPESKELEKVKLLKNDFGISYETLSRVLHVSHRTVLRWLHGECAPQPSHKDAIEKAVLLRNRMLKVLRKEAIPGYLMAYNEVLGGVRPLDLLTSGQAEKVAADIASLEAGVFV